MTSPQNRLSIDSPGISTPTELSSGEQSPSGVIQGRTTTPLNQNSPQVRRHGSLFSKLSETSTKVFSYFKNSPTPRPSEKPSEELDFKTSSTPVFLSRSKEKSEPEQVWEGNLIKPYNDPKFLEELIQYDNDDKHVGSNIEIFTFLKDLRQGIDDFKTVAYQRTLDKLVDKTLIKFKNSQDTDYESTLRKHYEKIKTDYFSESKKEGASPMLLNSNEKDKQKCISLIDNLLQQPSISFSDVENLNMALLKAVNNFSDLWNFSMSYNDHKNNK